MSRTVSPRTGRMPGLTTLLVALLITGGAGAALSGGPALAQQDSPAAGARARVLVLGSYHMANPGADLENVEADDVTATPRQRQIARVIDDLTEFAPTEIAVELTAEKAAEVDLSGLYERYRRGERQLGVETSELDQLAFRLADRLGHERVYPVDSAADLPLEELLAYAQEHGQGDVAGAGTQIVGGVAQQMQAMMHGSTVAELLRWLNGPTFGATHAAYLAWAQIGVAGDRRGAETVAAWYARNLKIFANIAALAHGPDDRILVIFGAGHGPLLRRFVADAPNLELVPASEYLPER